MIWSAISGALAIAVGVPLGVLLSRAALAPLRRTSSSRWSNLGTTIPTLAILALAMTVLGIGAPPAIFGLCVLTLLPIVLQHGRGPARVPPHLIEAARGMGMTPIADPAARSSCRTPLFVIFAGIRTALRSMSARRRSRS